MIDGCPTCSATLETVLSDDNVRIAHCPRCGTLVTTRPGGDPSIDVPKLVDRCREFDTTLLQCPTHERIWLRLGIRESIFRPEDRQPPA